MARYTLLCDIGNTNVKLGLHQHGHGMAHKYTLPVNPAETADSLGLSMLGFLAHAGVKPQEIDACAACSVVPALDEVVRGACGRYAGCPTMFAGRDMPVPLENRYERPQEVGADRLVLAWAAKAVTGAHTCINVDFGTATTFDCVSDNAYLGGLICPGVLSSAGALASRTAQLPRIRLQVESPTLRIGRSTLQCLNQGILFGFAAMSEGLCRRLREDMVRQGAPSEGIVVVASGGLASAVGAVCSCFDFLHPELLLEGLWLLYEETAPAT